MLNLLAVDLGASSGRVMHAAFDGHSVTLHEVRRFPNHPLRLGHRIYWNIYSLYQEMKWGIQSVARDERSIASLAMDSWAVDFALLDASNHLLDLPRHYRDPRNLLAMNQVVERVGRDELFRRSGIQINPINSLYQLYSLHTEDTSLLKNANTFLMVPDLLNFFLCGEHAAEFTNATTTQFLQPSGRWDVELLEKLGMPSHIFPQVVQPATRLSQVRDEELLQTFPSLRDTNVIHTASHDTAAAVLSVPAKSPHFVYISSGTWSLMGTLVEEPVIHPRTQKFNLTNEGGLGNYRLLKNVMGLWLLQETQRALQSDGEVAQTETLLDLAQSAPALTCLFHPDDTRLLQPSHMPETIRAICRETGQHAPDDTGALVRSILESLALRYRQVLEELESVTGKRYDVLHIVGGGVKNRLLCQWTANATKRPVVAGPVEASVMGNAAVQLLALGQVASTEELSQLILRSVHTVTYLPHDADAWDAAFQRFQTIGQHQMECSTMI